MKRIFIWVGSFLKSLRRNDDGFVVMATLGVFLLLFVLGASIYAVGETVRQKIRIQNACDAAAYSAAVVQADGLSRMASINRAMSETYIHMTNLQLDYITYRWLRLTAKRFKEDYDNAKEYHKWIVTSFDPKLGWFAILEVVVDAYTSRIFGAKCNYRHDKEGIGWWCGRGPNTKHNIMFNGHRTSSTPQSYEKLIESLNAQSPVMDESNVGSETIENKDGNDDEDEEMSEEEKSIEEEVKAIEARYQAQIEALDQNDPEYEDKKIQLERACQEEGEEYQKKRERKKEEENSSGSDNYDSEVKKINDRYDQRIKENPNSRDALNEQRRKELSELAAKESSNITSDDAGSVASTSVNAAWGSRIAKLIDADKETIKMLNSSLSIVNANMYESMQSTAKFVLTSMLHDPRLPEDKALKNISAYFYIPRGNNPYQISDTAEQEQNIFSPLYNTEPCERLFLHMSKTDKMESPLYSLFPIGDNSPRGTSKGWGLDQWFVRAGKNTRSSFPSIVRTEGALGIQRSYKDANINETGAGVVLFNRYASRGNHIANLSLENSDQGNKTSTTTSLQQSTAGNYENLHWQLIPGAKKHHTYTAQGEENLFKKMIDGILSKAGQSFDKIFSSVKGSMTDKFCDITPSVGNAVSSANFPMCTKSSDTTALFSEYDWSSAKWICLNRATFATMWLDYVMCKLLTGHCDDKIFYCNFGSVKHKKKRLFISFSYTHRGWGHYHFPKWFCGMKPKFQGNSSLGISDSIAKWTLLDLLPPLLPEDITGNVHGYMDDTIKWGDFFVPSKPLLSPENCSLNEMISPYHGSDCVLDKRRSAYRSCACFFDGTLTSWNYKGKSNYTGPTGKQTDVKIGDELKWKGRRPPSTQPILDSSDGGAVEQAVVDGEKSASKPVAGFINGHSRIYGDDAEIFDDRYIGEQCQPWVLNDKFFSGLGTIVVGAAIKHENPFVRLFNFWGSDDKDAGNTVLSAFDPPSVKGMSYKGKGVSGGNCIWAMSAARAAVRRNRRGGELDRERMYHVTYDATCDAHNLLIKNPHFYKAENALGWQSGLPRENDIPKIVAGCVCDGNSEKFKVEWNLCEQDWDATLLPIRYAGQGVESENGKKLKWKGASSTSLGEASTDVGNKNPLNPNDPSASWHPLDGSSPRPRLDSLLPDGKSRLRLEAILKKNKIL